MALIQMTEEDMIRRGSIAGRCEDIRPRKGYETPQEALDAVGPPPEGFQHLPVNDGLSYFGHPKLGFDVWIVLTIPAGVPLVSRPLAGMGHVGTI